MLIYYVCRWLQRRLREPCRSAHYQVRLTPPPSLLRIAEQRKHGIMRYENDDVRTHDADEPRSGVVLEKVCEYLYYNQKHAESKDVPDMEIPPELCLELLIAADYLDGEFEKECG